MPIRLLLLLVILASILAGGYALLGFLWSKLGLLSIPVIAGLLLVAGWGLKVLAMRALRKVFELPFRAKGAALKGATAQVHSVEVAAQENGRRGVVVDVTITPAGNPGGPFHHWEPGELTLIPEGTTAMDDENLSSDEDEEEPSEEGASGPDTSAGVRRLEIWETDRFVDDQGMKFVGPVRLRLHVIVKGQGEIYQFGYYFETFGRIQVPLNPARSAVMAL